MDGLAAPPVGAVWRHHTAREAVEVLVVEELPAGRVLRGHTTGIEEAVAYALAWEIEVGPTWVTRRAHVRSLLPGREADVLLVREESGRWTVDGTPRPDLDGVVDVDLEASVVTNTLPMHREPLDRETPGPSAYVRLDLTVEKLEHWYGPVVRFDGGWRVPYRAPRFEAEFDVLVDDSALVTDYPGLATRLR